MDFLQTHKLKRLPGYLFNYCKETIITLIGLKLGIYWFWAALRVFLTVWPQTGYIHPDEYFQTVEVFAGNAFGTEATVPWEFNSTFPIRSVPVIYLSIHLPFTLLRKTSEVIESVFGFTLISHYLLLVIPRLSMCLFSFISDVCLYKICYYFKQNYKERLVIYASSFVCLVFMSRTFTNAVEIICFNILLCLVSSSMAESESVIHHDTIIKEKISEAPTIPDRVRIKKLLKLLPEHSLNNCIPIAIVSVAGFFNRPTFMLYAIIPLFYWFQRGLDIKSTFLKDFHVRMVVFLMFCIPIICFFIYFDSAYYGYITWGEVLNLDIGMKNFVVTPFNFIKYNLNSVNLSKHGVHPRFLHLLINIPLMFNVLGMSGLLVIIKLLYRGTFSNWTLLPKSQSITGMMTLSFIFPVLGLSVFPHQEPRFIAPILLPLIFLYSHLIHDFDEHCKTVLPFRKRYRHPDAKIICGVLKYPLVFIAYLEKATENFDNRYNISGRYLSDWKNQEIVGTKFLPRMYAESLIKEEFYRQDAWGKTKEEEEQEEMEKAQGKKCDLTKYWYLFNIMCVIFFGFLHQGGIYGLSKDFHDKLVDKPRYTTYHLATSHVYSFPVHLLAVKKNSKSKNTNFAIHELGTENFDRINAKLATILKVSEATKKTARRNYKVFYALPSTLMDEFRLNHKNFSSDYSYEIENVFYPHISTEAMPKFILNITEESYFKLSDDLKPLSIFLDWTPVKYLTQFFSQFSLTLMHIKLPEKALEQSAEE